MKYPGYIALISAIMISAIITLIGLSISFSSLYSRTAGSVLFQKQIANNFANACLEHALLQLSLNNTYSGNETVTVALNGNSVQCSIGQITTSGSNKIVKARATSSGATTNLTLTVQAATLSQVSLIESSAP